jgi:hypothetical protein
VIIDQVAALTDAQAVRWHAALRAQHSGLSQYLISGLS